MTSRLTDDARVRAMVALLEAQAAQVVTLRRAVETLDGRLSLRNALDVMVYDEVQQSVADLRMALQALRRLPSGDNRSKWLADQASARVEQLAGRLGELLAPAPLASVPTERETLEELPFVDVLSRALATLPEDVAAQVRCEVPVDFVVSTAPARLAAVLAALVDNAARHGGSGAIACDARLTFGDLVVRVSDDGPGLRGIDPETLFPAPGRGLERDDDDHAGVGLYVGRMLSRSLGGELTLADRPEGGVVASVVLPQRRGDDAAPLTMREISAGW
jgi:K+-sensing histidine kinase KdpD